MRCDKKKKKKSVMRSDSTAQHRIDDNWFPQPFFTSANDEPLTTRSYVHCALRVVDLYTLIHTAMPRRSTRSSPSRQTTEEEQHTREVKDKVKNNDDLPLSSDGDSDEEQEIYEFNGIQFRTYQEMVQAKRERNQRVLQASGLLDMDLSNGSGKRRQSAASNKTEVSQRGLKRQRAASRNKAPPPPRRKSNRLQGIASDGLYVRDESGGRFTIAAPEQGAAGKAAPSAAGSANAVTEGSGFYRNRLNDGSDMTLEEAVTKHVGEKWFTDNALTRAQALCQTHLSEGNAPVEENSSSPAGYRRGGSPRNSGGKRTAKKTSPKSVLETLHDEEQTSPPLECPSRLLESLSVDRPNQVAKVVPDRIYGMAVHPGMDHLVVCAGDKQGYVGLWKCPDERESAEEDDFSNDVHLFKYHSGAAASLQWTSDGKSLFSTSYDGTCRLLDVATETVGSVFAAYDDEEEKYSNQPGYGLDGGYSYWTQFGCLDHRQEDCFFISTSTGCVYHIDSRIPGRRALTWQHELSERKINTVRYESSQLKLCVCVCVVVFSQATMSH